MYNNAFCKAISWNIAWVCSVRCGKCQLCKSVQICSNLFNALQPYATCDPHRRRTNQRTAFSAWSSWSKAAPTTRERVSMPTAFSNLGRKEIAKQTDTTNINKYQETNINKHQLIVRATRVCSNWLQTWLLCWKQDVATYTTQICVGIIPQKKNEPVNWHIQIGTLRDAYKTIQDQDKVLIGHTPCYLLLGCFRSSFSFSRALNILNLKSERTLWKHLKNVYITFIYSIFKKLDTISQSDSDFFDTFRQDLWISEFALSAPADAMKPFPAPSDSGGHHPGSCEICEISWNMT